MRHLDLEAVVERERDDVRIETMSSLTLSYCTLLSRFSECRRYVTSLTMFLLPPRLPREAITALEGVYILRHRHIKHDSLIHQDSSFSLLFRSIQPKSVTLPTVLSLLQVLFRLHL
jgi:hypothetical protein